MGPGTDRLRQVHFCFPDDNAALGHIVLLWCSLVNALQYCLNVLLELLMSVHAAAYGCSLALMCV